MCRIVVYTSILIAAVFVFSCVGYCTDTANNSFVYDAKGKRDPFISLIGQERAAGAGLDTIISPDDIKFEGVATGAGGKRIAILNGQMVKENDRFGSLLVKKILSKSVEISIEGRDYTLTLQEPEKDNAGNKK